MLGWTNFLTLDFWNSLALKNSDQWSIRIVRTKGCVSINPRVTIVELDDLGKMPSCSIYILRVLPGQQGWKNEVKTSMILSFFLYSWCSRQCQIAECYFREWRPGPIGWQKCEVDLNVRPRWAVELEWQIVGRFPMWYRLGGNSRSSSASDPVQPEIGQNEFGVQLPSPQAFLIILCNRIRLSSQNQTQHKVGPYYTCSNF